MASATPNNLTATYTSPTTTHTFSSPLPLTPSSSSSVTEKTSYMTILRTNTSNLQDEINAFLTTKMEEDKSREAGTGKKVKRDEERLEEMYGEEEADED